LDNFSGMHFVGSSTSFFGYFTDCCLEKSLHPVHPPAWPPRNIRRGFISSIKQ
jgi:hypothetical protein